jgi:CCR4-NOT transcription complex subunit 1
VGKVNAGAGVPQIDPIVEPVQDFSPEPAPSIDAPNVHEQTVIPNLASHVNIGANVALFAKNPHLKRIVPIAVDRAIREIIQPVVDRSVTIACVTTKELVLKDFAVEPSEISMRNAAHLMISNLAGSLALVTCKEPLRVSMGNHLRSLLAQTTTDQNMIEQVVQVCSNDNLELGCMLIEKAATEKAVRDVDEALTNAYQARKKHREQGQGQSYLDLQAISKSGRYPRDLPEPLRPKPGGLPHQQLMVYEVFQRTRQMSNRMQQSGPQPPGTHSPANQAATAGPNANLSMSQALESYQNVLMRIDQSLNTVLHQTSLQTRELTLAMLGSEHELFPLMREIITITHRTQAIVRDESAVTFAEVVFKRLMETHVADTLPLEVNVGLLEALRDACASKKFNPDILAWLTNYSSVNIADESSKKLHSNVLFLLMRARMLKPSDVDAYLCRHMDQGRNVAWVEFAMLFVRQCVADNIGAVGDFGSSIETVQRMLTQQSINQNPNAKKTLMKWLSEVRDEPKQVGGVGAVHPVQKTTAEAVGVQPMSSEKLREQVGALLERWLRIWTSQNESLYANYLTLLQQYAVLKSEERFAELR